jgi:hypothetical protein
MSTAITIAQDQERSKLAYSLQRRASIDLVGLVSIAAKCTKTGPEITFPLQFRTHHKCDQALVDGRKLTTPVQFSFAVVDEDEVEMVSLHCAIRADYEIDEGYEPTPEEIAAFSESNAVFNCWPYFRELVQSTLTRMNYPPLSIPFLRLIPKSAPPPKSPQPTQAELIEKPPQKAIEGAVTSRHRRKPKGGQ